MTIQCHCPQIFGEQVMNDKNYADFKMVAIDAKEVVEEVLMLINVKEEIIKYNQGPAPLQVQVLSKFILVRQRVKKAVH